MASTPTAGTEIFERILAAPGGLIVLEDADSASLIEQFQIVARHSGQSIYLWRHELGMDSLREVHARVPGSQRLGNALRYIQQSIHFGVYLMGPFPLPMSAADNIALRQLARAPVGHVRRVVLLDAAPALLATLADVAVRIAAGMRADQRPRLRDGRWLL